MPPYYHRAMTGLSLGQSQNLQIVKIALLCHQRTKVVFFGALNSPINCPQTHVSPDSGILYFQTTGAPWRKDKTILVPSRWEGDVSGALITLDLGQLEPLLIYFAKHLWWCLSTVPKVKVSNGWGLRTPNGIWANYQITVGKIASPILCTMSTQSTYAGGSGQLNGVFCFNIKSARSYNITHQQTELILCEHVMYDDTWPVWNALHWIMLTSVECQIEIRTCLYVSVFFRVGWLERGQFGFFSGSVHWSAAAGGYGMLPSDSRTPAWKGGPSLVLVPTLLMGDFFSLRNLGHKNLLKLCNSKKWKKMKFFHEQTNKTFDPTYPQLLSKCGCLPFYAAGVTGKLIDW